MAWQHDRVVARRDTWPITYAVLGLLTLKGPLTGYDLKRAFDETLSGLWGAAHSQIYRELRRLADLSWAEMEREEQVDRPDRKVYRATAAGREALAAWQREPVEPPQLRDEVLLRMVLGAFAPPGRLRGLLEDARPVHAAALARYQALAVDKAMPDAWRHAALAARMGVELEAAYLRWIDATLAALDD